MRWIKRLLRVLRFSGPSEEGLLDLAAAEAEKAAIEARIRRLEIQKELMLRGRRA